MISGAKALRKNVLGMYKEIAKKPVTWIKSTKESTLGGKVRKVTEDCVGPYKPHLRLSDLVNYLKFKTESGMFWVMFKK